MNEKGEKKPGSSGSRDRKRAVINWTKAIAILVLVVGTAFYIKTVLYPPVSAWEKHHQVGYAAYRAKNFSAAERHFKAALKEAETFPGDDWRLMLTLRNLSELYRLQSKHAEATPYLKRALEITEQVYGPDHPNVAAHLNNLALNYYIQGKLEEAEPLYKRALDIWGKILEPENDLFQFALKQYVDLLREMGRNDEANRYSAKLKTSDEP